ncbi:MAG: hypothetical protein GY856_07630 [bacterium]|nr:hypothetical protein [bacterium]
MTFEQSSCGPISTQPLLAQTRIEVLRDMPVPDGILFALQTGLGEGPEGESQS